MALNDRRDHVALIPFPPRRDLAGLLAEREPRYKRVSGGSPRERGTEGNSGVTCPVVIAIAPARRAVTVINYFSDFEKSVAKITRSIGVYCRSGNPGEFSVVRVLSRVV